MRLSLLLLLFCVYSANAQITTVKIANSGNSETIEPYDSLKNISSSNYKQLIGQTLFLKPDSIYINGYHDFYSCKNGEYHTYKPIKEVGYLSDRTDYSAVSGKYFKMIGYSKIKKLERDCLKLVETESNDTVYYTFSSKYSGLEYTFIVIGYIEKLKKEFVGKKYSIGADNNLIAKRIEGYGLKSLSNGEIVQGIKFGTIFTGVDIAFLENNYKDLICIYENSDYGKCYTELEKTSIMLKKDTTFNNEIDSYKKKIQDIETENIRKFGNVNGKLINQRKLKIGFTKSMCIASWGEPESINKTTGNYGVHEQWVYNDGNYLYFENGKLTAIQTHE